MAVTDRDRSLLQIKSNARFIKSISSQSSSAGTRSLLKFSAHIRAPLIESSRSNGVRRGLACNRVSVGRAACICSRSRHEPYASCSVGFGPPTRNRRSPPNRARHRPPNSRFWSTSSIGICDRIARPGFGWMDPSGPLWPDALDTHTVRALSPWSLCKCDSPEFWCGPIPCDRRFRDPSCTIHLGSDSWLDWNQKNWERVAIWRSKFAWNLSSTLDVTLFVYFFFAWRYIAAASRFACTVFGAKLFL